jgi:echinoderm microtubule-associated protein-like 6
MDDLAEGDEFMAVKPWMGAIKEPSGWKRPPQGQDKAPEVVVTPEWAFGYRGSMDKNNLRVMADGSIVYFVARMGVKLNPAGD